MIAELESKSAALAAGTHDYWWQSRRPLTSLFFVLPLLLFYEGGVLWLGADAIRNGADLWLQQLLGMFGFGGFLLVPVLTVGILLAWHHTSRQPWRVSRRVLYWMAAESTALALLLVVIANLQARVLSLGGAAVPCAVSGQETMSSYMGTLVRYFGAGIYEELLFRLILIPIVMAAIGLMVASRNVRITGALLATSLFFAAAHYVGPFGEAWELHSFAFRFVAGGFFAVLFVYRGFGIAAGTHALYDILVTLPTT